GGGGLNACLCGGDLCFRARDAGLRLLHPRILELLLPLVVDQAAFTRTYRGLGLVDLRAKVLIAQLYRQVARPYRLVVGDLNRGDDTRSLGAERRDVRPKESVVRLLLLPFAGPCGPVGG